MRTIILAFLASMFVLTGAAAQSADMDAQLQKITAQYSSAIANYRGGKLEECGHPKTMTPAQCRKDYDAVINAVEKEKAAAIKYVESLRDNGRDAPRSLELKKRLTATQAVATRLMSTVRARYVDGVAASR